MPTQQQIDFLHASLTAKAQTIQTRAQAAANKQAEKQQAKDAKEIRRAQISAPIAADKINYPNAETRTWATTEATAIDATYQTHLQTEYAANAAQTLNETQVELNRKLYRADELLLMYYANNPTA